VIVPFILLFSFLLSTLLFSLWFGFLKTVGFCATRGVDCPLDTAHGRRAYCRETKFGVYGLGWLIRPFLVATTARFCKRYRSQSQTISSKHFIQFAIEILRSIVPPSQVRETQLLCNIHCAGVIIFNSPNLYPCSHLLSFNFTCQSIVSVHSNSFQGSPQRKVLQNTAALRSLIRNPVTAPLR
jgi:hypothetical protein